MVKDILDGERLFVDPASRLQFITTDEVANIILRSSLDRTSNEIYNAGGSSNAGINEIANILNRSPRFRENAPIQYYEMNVDKLKTELRFPIRSSIDYLKKFRDGGNSNV